jgi:hypothetical protein
MERRIIARGLLAGVLAGVFSFLFARIFVEPVIARAVSFEEHGEAMAHGPGGHEQGVELFSRGVQANIGMGFGVLAFSVAMGALFAVVYCVAHGRVGDLSPRLLSVLIACGMLLSLYLIPALKYPASPPAASLAETIRQRTLLYLLMVVVSAAVLVAAVYVGRRLAPRFGAWNATLMAAGAYVGAVTLVMLVLPTIDETPEHFPADDLYEFRLYSLGTQVVMWTTIALVFAPLAARLLGEARRAETVPA